MAEDNRSRVFLGDDASPEEYNLFEGAARAELFDVTGNTAKEQRLKKLLGNHAKGAAYAGRTENFGNAEDLFARLSSIFGGKTAERAANELDALKQRGGDIDKHVMAFNKLAAEAGVDGAEKARRFKTSCNEGIRLHLITSGKTTFQELAEIARTVAPITSRQYERSKGGKTSFRREKANTVGEKRPFKGKCYNCDKEGHLARDCRQPKREKGKRVATGGDESETESLND